MKARNPADLRTSSGHFILHPAVKERWLLETKNQFLKDTKLKTLPHEYRVNISLDKEKSRQKYFIRLNVFDQNNQCIWTHSYEVSPMDVICIPPLPQSS